MGPEVAEPGRAARPATLRIGVILALGTLFIAGCSKPLPAEQQILATIDAMESAIEEGEVDEFMDPIAEDFIAGNSGLDRRMLGLLVRRERMARDRISVTRYDTEVELSTAQTRATASFRALATGGSGLLPDEGELWRFETGWRLDDDAWMLISAEWRRGLAD